MLECERMWEYVFALVRVCIQLLAHQSMFIICVKQWRLWDSSPITVSERRCPRAWLSGDYARAARRL